MNLAAGTRLGPYEVIAPLGAGGMGEVYRAKDTRLDRNVAIKVLPAELSENAQLRLRFEREAKAISSLTHPNICTLHDVGQHDGVEYLVMEYLEGETLAERLTRGALPLPEVLRYGIQIADALDKAHKQAIIHRDLKPGNIMLTKSGAKLLDFGLAKLAAGGGPLAGLSILATEQQPLTAQGTILGTFQYMAPEQLEGTEADARTDIFAFGAVLYEMATGQKAFQGKSKTSLIAAIVSGEPAPVSTLQPLTPPALERVIKTCLAKDPDDRWQTAHDVLLELRWIAEAGSQAGVAAPLMVRRKHRERLSWATLVAVAAAAMIFAMLWYRATHQRVEAVYSSILPPEKTQFAFDPGPMALSADGRKIAFVARTSDSKDLLFVRPLSASTAQPLSGTEGATLPFWSPDGRYLGFFAGGKLKKIDISGGRPQTLCDAQTGRGGSWNREGVIIFVPNARTGVHKVSAAGGEAVPVTRLDATKTEFSHRWPAFLPDARHFLYLAQGGMGMASENNAIYAGSLDSDQKVHLVRANSPALFSPPGYLMFWRDRTLLAQPFDPEKLKVTGESFPVAEDVQFRPNVASAIFTVSDNGTLAYQVGSGLGLSQPVWFDRAGKQIEAIEPAADYWNPRISPDGQKIVVQKRDPSAAKNDLWTYDLRRKVWTRFTFDPADEVTPVWSPDSNRVVFSSNRKSAGDLFWKIASGSGNDELVLEDKSFKIPNDWSRDGKLILFQNNDPSRKSGWDLWMYSIPDRKASPVLQTEFHEFGAKLSPDGKWILYMSNESGANQVYVQPFPPAGGKWQISTAGGIQPRWSRDGREIFYLSPSDWKLMSVEVRTTPNFEAGIPTPLFEMKPKGGIELIYDVSADGKRFLVNTSIAPDVVNPITLVQNWTAGLKR